MSRSAEMVQVGAPERDVARLLGSSPRAVAAWEVSVDRTREGYAAGSAGVGSKIVIRRGPTGGGGGGEGGGGGGGLGGGGGGEQQRAGTATPTPGGVVVGCRHA